MTAELDPRTEVYRDGRVHVRATPCSRCLLGPDRLVSGERARQLIADTRAVDGSTFICHQSDVVDDVKPAVCAGWWDRFAGEDPLLRLAMVMGVVDRVDGDGVA